MKRIINEFRLLMASWLCNWAGDLLQKAGEENLALEAYAVSIQAGFVQVPK